MKSIFRTERCEFFHKSNRQDKRSSGENQGEGDLFQKIKDETTEKEMKCAITGIIIIIRINDAVSLWGAEGERQKVVMFF
jgi:hypothetical protein